MIDCPGIVPPSAGDSDADILMRGVVRVENVVNPAQYVDAVLDKCHRKHVERTYSIKEWQTPDEFLELLARKSGRLLKGGEPDADAVARIVLNNFLRGRLPWFTAPPAREGGEEANAKDDTGEREGRLGEMGRKRKREEIDAMVKNGRRKVEAADSRPAEASGFEDEQDKDQGDGNSKDGSDSDDFEGFTDSFVVNPDAIGDLHDGDFSEALSDASESGEDDSSADDGGGVLVIDENSQ